MAKSTTTAPNGVANPSKSAKSGKKITAQWSIADEKALILFLIKQKAEGGDGGNFKKVTFQRAAEVLAKEKYKGGPKDWQSCKNKWSKVSLYILSLPLPHLQVYMLDAAPQSVLGGAGLEGGLRVFV